MPYAFLYTVFAYPLLYILPAYIANGAPVLFGGGAPLDMGKSFLGKRIFGDHKTVRGTIAMLAGGIVVGLAEYPFRNYMLAIAVLMSAGAIFGDLLGSFVKRRLGMREGASLPVMDQYSFFVFAVLFSMPLGHLPDIYGYVFIIVLTGLLHLVTNVGAHRLRLKDVPW
ncbi:MAG: CDP-2,3-bis-(O-geranylgeranyl)-sn-glycerol synthase [Candidatus Micrarchaeia archaeon]